MMLAKFRATFQLLHQETVDEQFAPGSDVDHRTR
jgi:hypothetical protein